MGPKQNNQTRVGSMEPQPHPMLHLSPFWILQDLSQHRQRHVGIEILVSKPCPRWGSQKINMRVYIYRSILFFCV